MEISVKDQIIHVKKRPWTKSMGLVASALGGLALVVGAASLLLVQKPLQDSQDLRRAASSDTGTVTMGVSPGTSTNLTVGQETNIDLTINTQGAQTSGVELTLNVNTDVTNQLSASVITSSGLTSALAEATPQNGGFRVRILALPATFGQPFTTTTAQPVARLTFTPTQAGSLTITMDPNGSLVAGFNANPPEDILRTAAASTYTVVAAADPTPSPTPSPSTQVTPSPETQASPSPSPSPSPSATPGTGGTTLKVCNETCSSNSECASELRCFEGRCRLATNTGSSTCAAPADQGLNRQCNEYCADSNECGNSYTCYFNRCRRPDNPDNTSCSAPTAAQQQAMARSCNQACSSNSQCATNLRCVSGRCRLATNSSSTTCSPASPFGGTTTAPKGAVVTPNTPTTNPFGTASVAPSSFPSPTPFVFASPSSLPGGELPDTTLPGEPVLPDETVSGLFGLSPSILGIAGLGLGAVILLIVLAIILMRRRRGGGGGGGQSGTRAATSSAYEAQLQQKINKLQSNQVSPPSNLVPPTGGLRPTPPPVSFGGTPAPMTSTTSVTAPVQPITPPPVTPVQPATPITPPAGPSINVQSTPTMMDRIRQHGIQPPTQNP